MTDKTDFEMLAELEMGTSMKEGTIEGIPFVILRGPCSLCAYLGIPPEHPLAGKNYDDINLSVHGGLTFGDFGDGEWRPKGKYWIGWDYGHWHDRCFYDLEFPMNLKLDWHEWTVDEVYAEVKEAAAELKKLVEPRP